MKKSELRQIVREVLKEELNKTNKSTQLKEARTSAEILAEIERLQQELAQARAAEKKATYDSFPQEVYAWDMYLVPTDKGTLCSAEKYRGVWDGIVYETENKALDAGRLHLQELDDEGELGDDLNDYVESDDYTIDVFAIPLKDIPSRVLERSNLNHLI